jgi:hypothetical protein
LHTPQLAKAAYSVGNDVDDEDFDYLMSEPSDPIQPLHSQILAKKAVAAPVKAAIIVKEENYDVDDLIADLDSSRKAKPPSQQPPVKYTKESEAFYR